MSRSAQSTIPPTEDAKRPQHYILGRDPKTRRLVFVPTDHPSPAMISDPRRRAAACAKVQSDLERAFKAARREAARPVVPRRTPAPRAAARRAAGRRSTASSSSSSSSGDDPPDDRPPPQRRGELRHLKFALADFLEQIRPDEEVGP
jgi:hypothetical protein